MSENTAQVTVEVYQGIVLVRSAGKVIGRLDRSETGSATINLGDDPDAETPDTEEWTPFTPAALYLHGQEVEQTDQVTYRNSLYTVTQHEIDGGWTYLSIKRNDRGWIRDWRHLQRIKNELLGPEREAIELYPAESRLVDEANQTHLWAPPPGVQFPVGFGNRVVTSTSGEGGGWRQRPFTKEGA